MIKFTIEGQPKPLMRHRMYRHGNKIIAVDPSKADKIDFLSRSKKYKPKKPFDIPLTVIMMFYMKRPKSHYRTGKYGKVLKNNIPKYHHFTPDLSNLVKFVEDSLQEIFWSDDKKIVRLICSKEYSENPRTEIMISEIKE
jgi:crossover junction endodeoxyribonuclease RusA